ncbi:MAG: TonB-dependent receptor, partial [Prevotellaceae bacterium]|nr:TonB-dependent receptor [Prevotellaceae bacterium]
LIRKAIDTSSISLANGFSHSLVRRRISMMHKTSNPWMQMKVLYILPLIIVALSAFATPAMKKPVEESFSSLEYRFINMEAIQSLHQNNKHL